MDQNLADWLQPSLIFRWLEVVRSLPPPSPSDLPSRLSCSWRHEGWGSERTTSSRLKIRLGSTQISARRCASHTSETRHVKTELFPRKRTKSSGNFLKGSRSNNNTGFIVVWTRRRHNKLSQQSVRSNHAHCRNSKSTSIFNVVPVLSKVYTGVLRTSLVTLLSKEIIYL